MWHARASVLSLATQHIKCRTVLIVTMLAPSLLTVTLDTLPANSYVLNFASIINVAVPALACDAADASASQADNMRHEQHVLLLAFCVYPVLASTFW